jgi:hypothetical protein
LEAIGGPAVEHIGPQQLGPHASQHPPPQPPQQSLQQGVQALPMCE